MIQRIGTLPVTAMSANGRFIVSTTNRAEVASDTNGTWDVYVYDIETGVTELITEALGGGAGNGYSTALGISDDGRYVMYRSTASNLIEGDNNGYEECFYHDRLTGETRRIVEANGDIANPYTGLMSGRTITADNNTFLVYSSDPNLIPGDENGTAVDTALIGRDGNVTLVGAGAHYYPAQPVDMSADGTVVIYQQATSLGIDRYYIWADGKTYEANSPYGRGIPTVSDDGQTILISQYSGYVADASSPIGYRYVQGAIVEWDAREVVPEDYGSLMPKVVLEGVPAQVVEMSADGRFVVFASSTANHVPGDTNGTADVFVLDRQTGATARVSVAADGSQGDGFSMNPRISADGRWITFESSSTNFPGSSPDAPYGTYCVENPFFEPEDGVIRGTPGDDLGLEGTAGVDTIEGLAGHDVIYGFGGGDLIDAGQGNDTVHAGLGADELHGGDGADTLNGDDGNDIIYGDIKGAAQAGDGSDTISGGAGADTIFTGGGSDTALGGADADDLYGELGDDFLDGDDGNDHVYGGAGRDRVQGSAGDDVLRGDGDGASDDDSSMEQASDGADELYGGLGNDRAYGGGGADIVFGDGGDDRLRGEGGDDQLYGGIDDDDLDGGDGADQLYGGDGEDVLRGANNADRLVGEAGGDTVFGGAGDDLVFGDSVDDGLAGADLLLGEGGADEIHGGGERDVIEGGADDDQLFGDAGGDRVDGGAGNDYVAGGAGDDVLFGDDGRRGPTPYVVDITDPLAPSTGADGVDLIEGGQGADKIFAGGGNDVAEGGADDDQLWGEAGDDRLDGGAGSDALAGGEGSDTIYGDDGVRSDGSPAEPTGAAGADLIQGGAGEDWLHGGGGADRIEGGTEKDRVWGDEGDDTIAGNGGDDILMGDAGNDHITGDEGYDANGVQKPATGQEGNDWIRGGIGLDLLEGGAGDDTLEGEADDDMLYGDAGADTLFGGAGKDLLSGGTENDQLDGGDEADTLRGGAGDDRLVGGEGDDKLYGGAGTDTLIGGAGHDTFYMDGDDTADTLRTLSLAASAAAAGADVADGGEGDDIFHLAAGATATGGTGVDTFVLDGSDVGVAITDFAAGMGGDRIEVSALLAGSSNPFATGHLRLEARGTDTALVFDADGTAGAGTGVDVALVQNAAPAQLTSANFTAAGADGAPIIVDPTPPQPQPVNKITGTARADLLTGTASADAIAGLAGNDVIRGKGGADTLDGGDGWDALFGEAGDDRLLGGLGNDGLDGGDGKDRLLGGDGVDALSGGLGDDVLAGGRGSDVLSGGAGNDRFVFELGGGADVIGDFRAGVGAGDVIDLAQVLDVHSFVELRSHLSSNRAGHAVINLGEHGSVTLTGVKVASLAADDFAFAAEPQVLGGSGLEHTALAPTELLVA